MVVSRGDAAPGSKPGSAEQDKPILVKNEFAALLVTCDRHGRGPRLRVEDLESGASTYLDPLELASLCQWPSWRREELLQVGPYDVTAPRPRDGEWAM